MSKRTKNPDASRASSRIQKYKEALFLPQPIERIVFMRVFLPLAILGFLSYRLAHADYWLTESGFQVPNLGQRDYRQPLYLSPLPVWGAWLVCAATVATGIMVSLGYKTRQACSAFCICLAYLALADRLAAFTVNKLGTVLILALCFTPCGMAHGWDALRMREGSSGRSQPIQVTWGNVRFFQALLVILYSASGFAKIKGDWMSTPHVLWTHLHDSYQTSITYFLATVLPHELWNPFQYLVLTFETLAPVWFLLPLTSFPALLFGLGMHAFIALCFGPVKWFAFLMAILLLGCFAPIPWLKVILNLPDLIYRKGILHGRR